MKKSFAVVALFFAFNSTINAQENKQTDPKFLAKSELNALVKTIQLDSSIENGFYNLLVFKHESLAKATTNEEKAKVYEIMKSKINSTLTPEQLSVLKKDKALYNDLIR